MPNEDKVTLTVFKNGKIRRVEHSLYKKCSIAILEPNLGIHPGEVMVKYLKAESHAKNGKVEINLNAYTSDAYIRIRHAQWPEDAYFRTESLWIPSDEAKTPQDLIDDLRNHLLKHNIKTQIKF